ncbi:MAG: acyltransferase [Mycolicibacterium rufum]|nr:acyltransferase [Mycolicibacterium rufum]
MAVLAVLAAHLTGWSPGGFVGIDVFFAISGIFVTDMLLRSAWEPGLGALVLIPLTSITFPHALTATNPYPRPTVRNGRSS